MKNTSGVSLAAGGSTPNERFQIANIISFEQSRVFDPPSVFDARNEGVITDMPRHVPTLNGVIITPNCRDVPWHVRNRSAPRNDWF